MIHSEENRDNNGGEAGSFSAKERSVKVKMADWADFDSLDKVKGDPYQFDAWLHELETRAEIYQYDTGATMKILWLKLDQETRGFIAPKSSLETAKSLLQETYGHAHRDPMQALKELLSICQGGDSITKYFLRYKKACVECERLKTDIPSPEDIFFKGLRLEHQRILEQRGTLSVQEMMKRCRIHETMGYVSSPRQVSFDHHQARPVFAANAQQEQQQHAQQQLTRFQQRQLDQQRELQTQHQEFQKQQMLMMKGIVDSMSVLMSKLGGQSNQSRRRGGGKCWDFEDTGVCRFGNRCRFTHGSSEEKRDE